jgi:hypothetical protein
MYLTPTVFLEIRRAHRRTLDSPLAAPALINGFGRLTPPSSRVHYDAVATDQETAGRRVRPNPTKADTRTPPAKITKPAVTRSGSALCGLIGFHQHLGLGMSVLSGVGWLVGSDHASFLARRRYGPRVSAYLSRRQPTSRIRQRAIALLQIRIVLPPRVATASYHAFARVNTIGAAGWGAYFVGTGYLIAWIWKSKRPAWIELVILAAATISVVGSDHALRRRTAQSGNSASCMARRECGLEERSDPGRRYIR